MFCLVLSTIPTFAPLTVISYGIYFLEKSSKGMEVGARPERECHLHMCSGAGRDPQHLFGVQVEEPPLIGLSYGKIRSIRGLPSLKNSKGVEVGALLERACHTHVCRKAGWNP